MSYQQRYKTTLTLKGTIDARYPASEKGGTMRLEYTHTEPVTIDIDVDTTPFDYSIVDCDKRIGVLRKAVVEMNSAQVAAKIDSSRQVAKHVTEGFFGLVRYDISQQVADLLSNVNAKLALLIEQKKASENILNQMQQDYGRLSGHYIELFKTLDDELSRRITALDSNSFSLSSEVMHKLILQNILSQASIYAIESEELGEAQSLMAASLIRSKVNTFIEAVHKYLLDHNILTRGLTDILADESMAQITNEYLPVIVMENSPLNEQGRETRYFVPEGAPQTMKTSIEKLIGNKAKSLNWKQGGDPDQKNVETEYYKLINDTFQGTTEEACARQRDMMIRLWEESSTASLSKTNKGV